MRKRSLIGLAAAALLLGAAAAQADFPAPPAPEGAKQTGIRTAVLAGGCFWGVEAVFERLKGVIDVTSGYSGGEAATAHYEVVGTGRTGHAESVRITYDAEQISYGTLLRVFFSVAHDPTQLNYQGPDVGPQYRSVIFYADEAQRRLAERYIHALDAAKVFPERIVTEVAALQEFYPAEHYHQDFLVRNPRHPYIVYWDLPKIAHLHRDFPELLQEQYR